MSQFGGQSESQLGKTDGNLEVGTGSHASSFPEYLAGELKKENKSREGVLEAQRGIPKRDGQRLQQPQRKKSS